MEFMDKIAESSNKAEVGFRYTVSKDSLGNYVIEITYDKVKVMIDKNGNQQFFDASNGKHSLDPTENALYQLLDASYHVTIDPNGHVSNIRGTDRLVSRMLTSFQHVDQATRKSIDEQMSKLVGDDFIKDLLQRGAGLFPDTAIAEGDQWKRKSVQKSVTVLNTTTDYKLVDVGDTIAKIQINAKLEADSPPNPNPGLNLSTFNINGNQEGYLNVNITTGLISESSMKASLSGVVIANHNHIPVTITTEKHIMTRQLVGGSY